MAKIDYIIKQLYIRSRRIWMITDLVLRTWYISSYMTISSYTTIGPYTTPYICYLGFNEFSPVCEYAFIMW